MTLLKDKQIERLGNGLASTVAVNVTPYTILRTDVSLLVDTTVPRTLILPAPSIRWQGSVWDVSGVSNILLQRNGGEKINGVAANYVLNVASAPFSTWVVLTDGVDWWVTQQAASSQVLPSFSTPAPIAITTTTTTTILTIPLDDNTVTSVSFLLTARDVGVNMDTWKDQIDVRRGAGGAPVQVGTSNGSAPASPTIASLDPSGWGVYSFSGNNLLIRAVTIATNHINVDGKAWIVKTPIAAAV